MPGDSAAHIGLAAPSIGDEEREAVDKVLRSGQLAGGPEVAAFEHEFSDLVDSHECVAVNSGTAALQLGLMSAGIGPGDEVIVPSFTFAATANAVVLAGATPVFVDIDPQTYCISPEAVRAAIGPRTAAIQAVHLYGHPAAMDELSELASQHGLQLVEDAAQAHCAQLNGKPVGSWGSFGAFSFYPTKNMTTGEGGMISCANSEIARQARLLRNQGMERRYFNEVVGFNARMSDLHAAIGRVQLRKLVGWTKQRQANAEFLTEHLQGVVTPMVASGAQHVFHQYTIRVKGHDRDRFIAELDHRGVGAAVYYPTPVHALPSFGLQLDLPATQEATKEVLSLPVHPQLSQEQLERIATAVSELATAGA